MASARELIIVAAERLIAERGVDVPLRDIAAAAGQRNNSAVQYHFGSRDGLIVPYEHGATHYARFLEQVRTHPALAADTNLDRTERTAVRLIIVRLDRALGQLPAAVRRRRLRVLPTVLFALLADRERAPARDDQDSAAELVDLIVGLLTAPVSTTASP